jgi:hypothetical protein
MTTRESPLRFIGREPRKPWRDDEAPETTGFLCIGDIVVPLVYQVARVWASGGGKEEAFSVDKPVEGSDE